MYVLALDVSMGKSYAVKKAPLKKL
ncbi:hypothetical protein ENT_29250 [Enterococcus faecalis]|nr:hypothetical protein ENT_29250 [Enterococcus faecalis]